MSIADDPSQWLSKPKDNTMDRSMRGFTKEDYYRLRDALASVYKMTSSPTIRRIAKNALDGTPPCRDEEELW